LTGPGWEAVPEPGLNANAITATSATSTTKPIWVKMLFSIERSQTPPIELNRHIGTMRMIASGNNQLS